MFAWNEDFCERLVATLTHSLWQGLIVGLGFTIAMRCLRSRSPQLRHAVSVISLGIFVASVSWTFLIASLESPRATYGSTSTVAHNKTMTGSHSSSAHDSKTEVQNEMIGSKDGTRVIPHVVPQADLLRKWTTWLSIAYLSGVGLGLIRLAVGVCTCHVLCRSGTPVLDHEWLRLADQVRIRIGLRTAPPIRWCKSLLIPTVVGIARPVILLPISCATGLFTEQIEQILLHEMMHIRRRDALVNIFVCVTESLLFFHPVIWIVSRRIRLERELCCDFVVASSAAERWRYAQLLVTLAEHAHRRSTAATQLAIVSEVSQLRTRIESLMNRSQSRSGVFNLYSFSVLLTVLILLSSSVCHPIAAAPPEKARRPVVPATPGLPEWYAKKLQVEEQEHREQAEQLELSKNWPLAYPDDVRPNELAGIIVDSDGHPIAGALVDCFPAFKGDETTTDENGFFRYIMKDAGPNDTMEVRFSKDGYSPVYRRAQMLGVAKLALVLNNKTYVEGQVIGKDGDPIADLQVIAAHPYHWSGDYVSFDREIEAKTDTNGRYRLYLSPDTYVIKAISNDRGVAALTNVIVVKDQKHELDLQLQDGIVFRVQVLDSESKKPVEGFVLYHPTDKRRRGTSDAKGMLEISNLVPGDEEFNVGSQAPVMTPYGYYEAPTFPFGGWWSPHAKKPWHNKKTTEGGIMFRLFENMDSVTLYVEPGVRISGRVTDPDGNPVAGATVAPARTGTGNSLTGDTAYSVTTNDDGTYQVYLPSISSGEYNLIAHDGGYSEWRHFAAGITEPMQTKPGQRIKNLDIKLHRPARVIGQVKASDGRKVGGLEIRAHAYDKRGNRYYDPTTRTNDDGTFEVRFIRPGKQYIQVGPFQMNAEDAPAKTSVIVELKEGETKAGVELNVPDQR